MNTAIQDVELVCLANSRKYQGRCIAGLKTDGSGWMRPVSAFPDGALDFDILLLPDGSEPQALDILQVSLLRPRPTEYHPEDWQIARRKWNLVARPAPEGTETLLRRFEERGPLLLDSDGDRIPARQFQQRPASKSLCLVQPQNLQWIIQTGQRGNRQTRAQFTLAGTRYNLTVTDPAFEQRMARLPLGPHPLEAAGLPTRGTVWLTISLSEPFEQFCYKLVAAVFVL